MPTPSRILVPTDFSSAADRALDAAIEFAKALDADVLLLHVYTLPTALYGGALFWPSDDYRRAAKETLESTFERAKALYPGLQRELVEGEPWEKILEVAEAKGSDLIVMGTRGRRGLSHTLIGSVTERVLRSTRVPVLTVSEGAILRAERQAARTIIAPA